MSTHKNAYLAEAIASSGAASEIADEGKQDKERKTGQKKEGVEGCVAHHLTLGQGTTPQSWEEKQD